MCFPKKNMCTYCDETFQALYVDQIQLVASNKPGMVIGFGHSISGPVIFNMIHQHRLISSLQHGCPRDRVLLTDASVSCDSDISPAHLYAQQKALPSLFITDEWGVCDISCKLEDCNEGSFLIPRLYMFMNPP